MLAVQRPFIPFDQGSGMLRGDFPVAQHKPRPIVVWSLLPVISKSYVPPAGSCVIALADGGSLTDLGPWNHYKECINNSNNVNVFIFLFVVCLFKQTVSKIS